MAHYLDDFVTTGDPEGDECGRNADIMHGICEQLGMPVEPEKDEGPATVISFLGLELDSTAMEVRLPLDKLTNLRALLTSWRGRKACKKRELLSLIGSLAHASKAIKPGRSYLRWLINLSTITRRLDQFIRLSREARADIEWWASFASEWNGTAMMVASPGAKPQVILTSDASGMWGILRGSMVYASLGSKNAGYTYNSERASPNCSGGNYLGKRLARKNRPSTVRQHSGGGNCQLWGFTEPRGDATKKMPGLPGGEKGICHVGNSHSGGEEPSGGRSI